MRGPLAATGVRVPCSTSNLGSGFDVLGLALDRYLEATFEPGGTSLELQREGTLEVLSEAPTEDLLAWAFTTTLHAHAHDEAPLGVIRMRSAIPLARGLGSSAAALVAGHDLAMGALGLPPDPEGAFRLAAGREGHGDNAAPCALGGLRAVVPTDEGLRALELDLSPGIGCAYAAPATGVSTHAARAALPAQVAHGEAVAGLGRLAALIEGLAQGDPELLRAGLEDRLHVPYRLPLIPRGSEAMEAAREAGAWAVTISGSGSGLLALCAPEAASRVAEAMRAVFSEVAGAGPGVGFALRPDLHGLRRDP